MTTRDDDAMLGDSTGSWNPDSDVKLPTSQKNAPIDLVDESLERASLDAQWVSYVTAHPWINQAGYIPAELRKRAPRAKNSRYDEWLLSCGYTPYAYSHAHKLYTARPSSTADHCYTNARSTGRYDYDGNLTDLTLSEIALAYGIGTPCPFASLDGDDNFPDTPYETTDQALAEELLHRGIPLQPPLDERTAKHCGTYVFLNPGNTTAAAAWWPSRSAAERAAIMSHYELWWRAIRKLQRHYVSETYQPMRYNQMVRVKHDTERRVTETVRYPGEQRDQQSGEMTACPNQADLGAAGATYVVREDDQRNLVANGVSDGQRRAYGEEKPGVQGRGTYSVEYLRERVAEQRASGLDASADEEEAVCWWAPKGTCEDDALNAAYAADLGVKEALRLAWRCGTNHAHRDGLRRCMAMIEWAERLFGTYVAGKLLDYFDYELAGGLQEQRIQHYSPKHPAPEPPDSPELPRAA